MGHRDCFVMRNICMIESLMATGFELQWVWWGLWQSTVSHLKFVAVIQL